MHKNLSIKLLFTQTNKFGAEICERFPLTNDHHWLNLQVREAPGAYGFRFPKMNSELSQRLFLLWKHI